MEIVRGDLPQLTEADLAAILRNAMTDGARPIAAVVEPVIRAELSRRQAARTTSPILLTAA